MLRNWQLATFFAITISVCGAVDSVYAGGHGNSGGHSGGRSFGGSSGGFSSRISGGFKPSSGGFKPSGGSSNGGSSGVVRSGNLGGVNLGGFKPNTGNSSSGGMKTLPKNTGVVGPIVNRVGSSNGSNNGLSGVVRNIGGTNTGTGIKLPAIGGSSSNASNSGISGIVKKANGNSSSSNAKSAVLGNLGINLGGGSGNGNSSGGSVSKVLGGSHHHHDHHDHHHHGHNHCWPPIVLTLPHCQPNYCPPPCPPIYYPQPYPVAVPVAEPVPVPVPVPTSDPAVVVNNNITVTGNEQPMDAAADKPVETAQPAAPQATDVVKTDAAEVTLPKIPVGATLTLQGKDLSEKQGQVVLQLGDIALPATINEWKNDAVTCTLPLLGLSKASKATLHVVKADGKTASTMDCELVTTLPTSLEVAPASATDVDVAKFQQ